MHKDVGCGSELGFCGTNFLGEVSEPMPKVPTSFNTILSVTGKIDLREWKPKAKKDKIDEMPMGMAAEKTEAYE